MFDLAERCGVRPVKIPSLGREISFWNDAWTTFLLWRYMRKHRPHIVHTHTSKAGFSGRIAARLAGVPVVVHTFHGHVFGGYFGPAATQLFIRLERFLARLSDKIITISERLRDDLIEKGIASREKIEVIELGLNLAPFLAVRERSNTLRATLKMGVADPLVGIVGRLVPIKDHVTFLKAAARVAKARDDVKFAIIGDGELRADLEALGRTLGLNERIYFAGWEKDLAPIYADLDLIVLSSRNEGTPVSIIEGSAAGKPVVATCVGGIPDMIADGWNGLLVPPGDPEALAKSILRMIESPRMAETFVQRSREKIKEKYGIQRLVCSLESLYIHLLREKGISLQGDGKSADVMVVR